VAQSKALECLQKRALNVIFPGGEYATNLIIANVETLSHDDGYTLTAFLQTVISLGGHGPLAPLWIPYWNKDIGYMLYMILKTMPTFNSRRSTIHARLHKDAEDTEAGKDEDEHSIHLHSVLLYLQYKLLYNCADLVMQDSISPRSQASAKQWLGKRGDEPPWVVTRRGRQNGENGG